jgi:hypothetical protein
VKSNVMPVASREANKITAFIAIFRYAVEAIKT